MNCIHKDGVLWINGFNEVPNDNPNVTESDLLKESDFASLESYNLVDQKIYEINQRKFIRCIWKNSRLELLYPEDSIGERMDVAHPKAAYVGGLESVNERVSKVLSELFEAKQVSSVLTNSEFTAS
nr:hypothetical protein [uncultured Niameybacter sp.]